MVLVDPPHDDPVATLSDELPGGDNDPLAFLNLDDPAPELVAAAGKEGEEADLANKDAFPTLDTTATAEVVAAGGKDGERWNELPSSGDIFQDFVDYVTPKVVAAGDKDGDNEELPWLTNKDAFQGDSVPWASFPNDIPSDDEYLLALLHDDVAPKVVAPGGKDGDIEEQLSLTVAPAEAGAAAVRSPTPSPPPRRRTPVMVVDAIHSDPVTLDTMAPEEDRAKAARPRRKCVRGLGAAAEWNPTPPPSPRRRTPVVGVDALHNDPVPVAALLDELPGGNDVAPKVVVANKGASPTLDTMALPDAGAQAARPRRKCVRPLGAAARSPTPPSPPRFQTPAKEKRECEHCGTDETPLWRKGPEGRPTLCNACGMRLKKGKLQPEYRPLKSPTFSPDLHSNLHRRVLDMARCREEEEAKASDADATSSD